MEKEEFFKLMGGTWVFVTNESKDDIMSLLDNLGYTWESGGILTDNDWCGMDGRGSDFYIRLYKYGRVCYAESVGLDDFVISSYQDLCKLVLKHNRFGLFDKQGNIQKEYEELDLEDILEAMGCGLSDDGGIRYVDYTLINSMKSNNYNVDCDFIKFYYAIHIALGSGQSPYYVLDKWL